MALDVNTGYNAAFKTFVDFAQKAYADGHKSATTKATLVDRTLTVSALSLYETSRLLRKAGERDANDNARELFRRAICDMFGGNEAGIPQNVKDAMQLSDYGKGRPLTAHRIMAVKAEVDRIISNAAAANNGIVANITAEKLDQLPQDIQNSLADIVNKLRETFGADQVPPNAKITNIVSPDHVDTRLRDFAKSASAQGRELAPAEVAGVFIGEVYKRFPNTVVGSNILAKIQQRNPDIEFSKLALGAQFCTRHPGFMTELLNCKNPGEVAAVFQRHEAEIDTFVDIAVRGSALEKSVEGKVTAKLAERLGLNVRLVAAHVPTGKICVQASDLTRTLMNGSAPGSREPGFDMEAAYDELVERFVQERVDVYNAVDVLDLPTHVKDCWKAEYIGDASIPPIAPAQLLTVAQSVNVDKIVNALAKGMPTGVAVPMLQDVNKTICDAICQATGNPDFFNDKGEDDMTPIYTMLFTLAEARNPALSPAIHNAGADCFNKFNQYCERNVDTAETVLFIKLLSGRGGLLEAPPITDEERFLEAVKAEADAAFDGFIIKGANPELREQFKTEMSERASAAFGQLTSLLALSDHLATIKDQAVKP